MQLAGATAVGVGLAAGALTYFLADRALPKDDEGAALTLGAFLDGIPEQLVLGIGLAAGDGVSVGLLAAIFLSNLPEAIGSASGLHAPPRKIIALWVAVARSARSRPWPGSPSRTTSHPELQGAANGFAAGALLVMLIDSMIPEAQRKGGNAAGLVTVLGFAVAAGLTGIG